MKSSDIFALAKLGDPSVITEGEIFINAADNGFDLWFTLAGVRLKTTVDSAAVTRANHDRQAMIDLVPTVKISRWLELREKEAFERGRSDTVGAIKALQIETMATIAVAEFIAGCGRAQED